MIPKGIQPNLRYTLSFAARQMGICRQTLYNYIKKNLVKTVVELDTFDGKYKQYISGLEIIKYINNRFYEA